MMVLFQDKIIYMPGVPLFSRKEKIADYLQKCAPVKWREERIFVPDGTEIALCIGSIDDDLSDKASETVILYFQG